MLHHRLANGLDLFVREDHRAPVAISNLWVRVGSNDESGDVRGWAHGIEHMLFKGTARRGTGDISREVKQAGGELNASTGYHTTQYYIVLPSDRLETALDIHADCARNPRFDGEELERERGVLTEELRMRFDHHAGGGHTWDALMATAFRQAAYRHSIVGSEESLRDTPREAILRFFGQYYVPGNCALVVAGDVEPARVVDRVERLFGEWPAAPPPPRMPQFEPPQTQFRLRAGWGEVDRVYLKLGFHAAGENHPAAAAQQVLVQLLGRGRSARLVQEVREKRGLVSSVRLLDEAGPDIGYLVVDAVTGAAEAAGAQEAILAELGRLALEPPSPREMERARATLERDWALGMETVDGQAAAVGHGWAVGDPWAADSALERIRAVTVERVVALAESLFSPDRCAANVHAPQAERARLEPLVADPVAVAARLARAWPRRPAPAAAPRRARRSLPEIERAELPAGGALVTRRIPGAPLATFGLFARCGTVYETLATSGISGLAHRAMIKGAAGRTAAEIAMRIEALGGSVSPVSGSDVCGFFVTVLRNQLDEAWPLLAEITASPDFPAAEVARERELALAEIAALEDHPLRLAMREFQRAVFGPRAYGLPGGGTRAAVEGMTREDLAAWHRRFYRAGNLAIVAAGDFAPAELAERAAALAAGFAGGGAPGSPEIAPAGTPGELAVEKEVSQAVIVLGFPGPPAGSGDRFALEVLESVLGGMGNRLFVELRDRRSLCYFTGFFYRAMRWGGLMGAYVGTSPEKEAEALGALRGELGRIREEGPTAEELERAGNTLVGNFAVDLQTASAFASLDAGCELLGLGADWPERYAERVRAVTAADVRRAAERHLDLEGAAVVTVRPAR